MGTDLTGRTAIVTGASRGIGLACAQALLDAGANVVLTSRKQEAADEAAASLGDERAVGYGAHVTDEEAAGACVAFAVERFGSLDILVNNAGICPFHEFLTMPEELWDRVQDVNLKGVFLCSQAAANQMIAQGNGGRIVSISSISALVGGGMQTHYTPTKAGIHSFMQSIAIVLGPHGITCNSVLPGAIETDINKEDLSDPEKRAYFNNRIPVGRLGAPDDIAGPVVFLASEEARYVNGAALLVDGGLYVNTYGTKRPLEIHPK